MKPKNEMIKLKGIVRLLREFTKRRNHKNKMDLTDNLAIWIEKINS